MFQKLFIFGLAFCLCIKLSFPIDIEDTQEKQEAVATVSHRSGILRILESSVNILKAVINVLKGQASVKDVVIQIQNTYRYIRELVNIKGIIAEIPFIGKFVIKFVGPILDMVGSLINNTPVFGGILSQIIVGPVYPASAPPVPNTPMSSSVTSPLIIEALGQ